MARQTKKTVKTKKTKRPMLLTVLKIVFASLVIYFLTGLFAILVLAPQSANAQYDVNGDPFSDILVQHLCGGLNGECTVYETYYTWPQWVTRDLQRGVIDKYVWVDMAIAGFGIVAGLSCMAWYKVKNDG